MLLKKQQKIPESYGGLVVVCKKQWPFLTKCSSDKVPPLHKNNIIIYSYVLINKTSCKTKSVNEKPCKQWIRSYESTKVKMKLSFRNIFMQRFISSKKNCISLLSSTHFFIIFFLNERLRRSRKNCSNRHKDECAGYWVLVFN